LIRPREDELPPRSRSNDRGGAEMTDTEGSLQNRDRALGPVVTLG
jgi:hypothetical protein